MARTVEIYVRCPNERLLGWVASLFGEVTPAFQADDVRSKVYRSRAQGNEIELVLTLRIEDGPFTCVPFFPIPRTPWRNDVECARQAARELACEVRCDPVAIHPRAGPGEFLRIHDGREDYVDWWAEIDEKRENRQGR
jgi:hypothetical protein